MSENGEFKRQHYQSNLSVFIPKRFRTKVARTKSLNHLADSVLQQGTPPPILRRGLSRSWSPLPTKKLSKISIESTPRQMSESLSLSSYDASEIQAVVDGDIDAEDQPVPKVRAEPRNQRRSSAKIEHVASKLWSASVKLLSPDFKARSEEFSKHFDLPETEKYLAGYSCALQKDILVHGRMYLSVNYMCFYANILGVKTNITVNWNDITTITKERTARLIPNAIQVTTTADEKLFFSSLTHREKVYRKITKIWKSSLVNEQLSSNDVDSDDECSDTEEDVFQSGDFTGNTRTPAKEPINQHTDATVITPSEETVVFRHPERNQYSRLSLAEPISQNSPTDGVVFRTSKQPPAVASAMMMSAHRTSIPNIALAVGSPGHQGPIIESPLANVDAHVPISNGSAKHKIDQGDPVYDKHTPDSATDHHLAAEDKTQDKHHLETPVKQRRTGDISSENEGDGSCPCLSHQGREMTNIILPLSVDQLFLFLFSDSEFYRDVSESRGLENIVAGEWIKEDETGRQVRKLNYVINLGHPLGPKQTTTDETQVMDEKSKPGKTYVVKCDVYNHDVPYGDTFYVLNTYCIARITSKQCRLTIHGAIIYRKSCWGVIKSFIEKNALSGMQDYYDMLTSKLKEQCRTMGVDTEKEKHRKHKAGRRASKPLIAAERPHQHASTSDLPQNNKRSNAVPQARSSPEMSANTESLARIIFGLMLFLLLGNCCLFYKLRSLDVQLRTPTESQEWRSETDIWKLKFLKLNDVLSNDQWLKVIQKQQEIHQNDVNTWSVLAGNAFGSLEQVEMLLRSMKSEIEYAQLSAQVLATAQAATFSGSGKPSDYQSLHIKKQRMPVRQETA